LETALMDRDRTLGEEFAARRAAATGAARERGLKGLLVCSRGGGTLDRYADVMYLASFYTPFPYIPDQEPRWAGRAHAFLLLPVAGEPLLIVDVPHHPTAQTGKVEIVTAPDTVGAVAEGLRARSMAAGEVGIAGADTIPWSVMRRLAAEVSPVSFVPADDILSHLRAVKSPREIALLRRASEVGSRALDAMMDAARPGVTHAEVFLAGQQMLISERAIMQNAFMISGRGGENATVVRNAFPTFGAEEPLAEGQWFQVGISGVLDGYLFDLARSTAVGETSPPQVDAFETAIACVDASIAAIRPGATASHVAEAGLGMMRDLGYDLGGAFAGMGHGIGLGWDAPWLIPGDETVLQPGMVLCVERGVRRDGFSGDFEETVLVTESGPELLTPARIRRW
jgi:Xaa-Pro aminopeptidase